MEVGAGRMRRGSWAAKQAVHERRSAAHAHVQGMSGRGQQAQTRAAAKGNQRAHKHPPEMSMAFSRPPSARMAVTSSVTPAAAG